MPKLKPLSHQLFYAVYLLIVKYPNRQLKMILPIGEREREILGTIGKFHALLIICYMQAAGSTRKG
jgi:hypothetical protein